MKLRRTQNRVYHGKIYEKWILVLPPEDVKKLGWTEGIELEPTVKRNELRLRPARKTAPNRVRRIARFESLRALIHLIQPLQ
jgi:bifunctional DNA-binding transcriptional regulator/antitoxin component of YhaV-PrlF toxin-antitoxin module